MMIRPQFTLFSVCFAVGLLLSLCIAWLIAVNIDPSMTGQSRNGTVRSIQGMWFLTEWNAFGSTLYLSRQQQGMIAGVNVNADDPRSFAPAWSGLNDDYVAFVSRQINSEEKWIASSGWPLPCLWSQTVATNPGMNRPPQHRVDGGIQTSLSPWRTTGNARDRVLPCTVRLPPLLLNALFWGVLLWLPPGLAMYRRSRRDRRGRCPQCNYDLRGNPEGVPGCPECGWGRDEDEGARG